MQPVGKLDDDDPHVRHHGQQHLADVLRLVVFAIGELDLIELGDSFDDVRDLVVEAPGDLRTGHVRVFNGIVQQAGGNGRRIHLQVRKNLADLKRMDDVRLAAGTLLALMLLHAEDPGRANELQVVVGPVIVDGREQVLEPGFKALRFGPGFFRSQWRNRLWTWRWLEECAFRLGERTRSLQRRTRLLQRRFEVDPGFTSCRNRPVQSRIFTCSTGPRRTRRNACHTPL